MFLSTCCVVFLNALCMAINYIMRGFIGVGTSKNAALGHCYLLMGKESS